MVTGRNHSWRNNGVSIRTAAAASLVMGGLPDTDTFSEHRSWICNHVLRFGVNVSTVTLLGHYGKRLFLCACSSGSYRYVFFCRLCRTVQQWSRFSVWFWLLVTSWMVVIEPEAKRMVSHSTSCPNSKMLRAAWVRREISGKKLHWNFIKPLLCSGFGAYRLLYLVFSLHTDT